MNSLIYVPGEWICDRCKFIIQNHFLQAQTGGVFVNNRDIDELCPNDGQRLRRYTWKELAESQEAMILGLLKEKKGN